MSDCINQIKSGNMQPTYVHIYIANYHTSTTKYYLKPRYLASKLHTIFTFRLGE